MARKAVPPHAFELVQAIEAVHAGEPVVVACSGGADSMALAACSAVAGRRRGFAVRAVVVDHGLQAGSARRAGDVVERLSRIGVPALAVAVQVIQDGSGIEAAAREVRYAALAEQARSDERIYLGHTLDDQAETVLLGLARGSGLRSLAGMRTIRGRFVRPLLGIRAAVTRLACAELGLTVEDDPHNSERRFARARVRHDLLPDLEDQLGPGVAEALARTATLAGVDTDFLDDLAVAELRRAQGPDGLALTGDWTQRPALAGRVVREWLLAAGARGVTHPHLEAVLALVADWRGQRWVDLPGVRVGRRGDHLVLIEA